MRLKNIKNYYFYMIYKSVGKMFGVYNTIVTVMHRVPIYYHHSFLVYVLLLLLLSPFFLALIQKTQTATEIRN